MQKEIVGILILKLELSNVLKLRLLSKKFNSILLNYNKYWFVKYINQKFLPRGIQLYRRS